MTILNIWDSIWIGCLASIVLYGCYRAVQWRWPERYIGMHETFGLSTQETWLRFLGYRALPTYLVAATTCITVERVGGWPWVSAAVMWMLSVLLTHGRVVFESLRSRPGEANYGGYHLQMILLLTSVMLGAVLSRHAWGTLVPPPEEFLGAIWSGLLVAGLGGFVVFALRPRSDASPIYGANYFVERATKEVGVELLDWLYAESVRTGADPLLLKSLLVVEVVQRPRWFRRLENLGVRLGVAKTSGAMQMPSRRPLSDRESISRAAEAYAGAWSFRYNEAGEYSTWAPDLGQLWPVTTRHNGDVRFTSAVAEVATSLAFGTPTFTYLKSPDVPIVFEIRRYAKRFALRGASHSSAFLFLEFERGTMATGRIVSQAGGSEGDWWAWEEAFSPAAERLVIIDLQSGQGAKVWLHGGEVTNATWFAMGAVDDSLLVPEPSAEDDVGESSSPSKQEVASSQPRKLRIRASRSRGPR